MDNKEDIFVPRFTDKDNFAHEVSGDKPSKTKKTVDKPKTPAQQKKKGKGERSIEDLIESKIKANNGQFIVDVCFNDNICGGIKICLYKQYQEVISIPLDFDIGYLKEDALENQIENIFNFYMPFGVSRKECNEIFDEIKQSINKVVLYAKKGASLRIWKENTPSSLCGLYYLINLLSDIDCTIYENPFKHDCRPNLDHTVELTKEQIKNYSLAWDLLVEENAPLRVFKNGVLTGVDKTYFDDLILHTVNKKKISVFKLVGEVLRNNRISCDYIYKRVYHLVDYGYLKIVGIRKHLGPNFYPYRHIVKKAD